MCPRRRAAAADEDRIAADVALPLPRAFRWPVDQVLLVGLGMVALPIPIDGAPLVQGLPLPIGGSPARANLLIFVECKGPLVPASNPAAAVRPPLGEPKNYRGRY